MVPPAITQVGWIEGFASIKELKDSINTQFGWVFCSSVPNNGLVTRTRLEKKLHSVRWKFRNCAVKWEGRREQEQESWVVSTDCSYHMGKLFLPVTLSKRLYFQASQEVWGTVKIHYARLSCKRCFCRNFSCRVCPAKTELCLSKESKPYKGFDLEIWLYKATSFLLLMVKPSTTIVRFRAQGKMGAWGTQKHAVGRKAS